MKLLAWILEFTWFAAAIGCALSAYQRFSAGDTKTGILFCIFCLISVIMFYFRRIRRLGKKFNHKD